MRSLILGNASIKVWPLRAHYDLGARESKILLGEHINDNLGLCEKVEILKMLTMPHVLSF